jgi:hypothetical protein
VSQIGFYLNILAVGFAVSGVVSSFYQLVTSEHPEFLPFSKSPGAVMATIMLSMFAGPFIIARKAWAGLVNRETQAPLILLLLAICGLWSFYSGVAVLYFAFVIV